MNVSFDLNNNRYIKAGNQNKIVQRNYSPLTFGQNSSQVAKSNSATSKLIIGASSILGTLVPMMLLAKHQHKGLKFNSLKSFKEIFKIKFEAKEMIIVSASSIAAGTAAGIYSDKEHKKNHKIKNGVFQFFYSSVPPLLVEFFNKKIEKTKALNNIPGKIGGIAAGVAGGMTLGAMAANKITDPEDQEEDKKVKMKDLIFCLDDALGALVLAKLPFVDKLPTTKILAGIYALSGYKSGNHK